MLCKLTYGVAADGSALHISKAKRGEECGCTCPGCDEPLVARKGDITQYHYAHAHGTDCPFGFINSLYFALRDSVEKLGFIALPEYVKNRGVSRGGEAKDNIRVLIGTTRVKVERVEFVRKGGMQIIGLMLYCSGKPLMLRILAGYSEVRASLDKIKQIGFPVVEIDLSRDETLTDELAHEYIGSQNERKYWIYNAKAEQLWDSALSMCAKLKTEGEGDRIKTYGCPSAQRRESDSSCLVRKGCRSCPFFYGMYGVGEDRYLLCGRDALLADPRDASLTYEQRRGKYAKKRS